MNTPPNSTALDRSLRALSRLNSQILSAQGAKGRSSPRSIAIKQMRAYKTQKRIDMLREKQRATISRNQLVQNPAIQ